MIKRKFIPVLLPLILLIGCTPSINITDSDKIRIVCTIFPEYDWTRVITNGADNIDITLLADNGTDFHSYQPGTGDIVTILSCDVLIYVGGESDKWIDDALENSTNPNMHIIRLSDIIESDLLSEPETHDDKHEHEHHHHDEENSFDEHVWLSLKNTVLFCDKIADALSETDGENADIYKTNAEDYIDELHSVDSAFEKKLLSVQRNTVLFADRFPFVYLMEDYGINYYAAFPGCSSETDASFDTVVELAIAIDTEKLPAVLTIEGSDCNIADAVISNTEQKNQSIHTLDSMQTVKREDIDSGKTYLSIMEKNFDVIMEVLN